MKKKLSLFLIFCMVLGLMTPGVTAFDNNDNGVIITTDDYEVKPGEEFWVDFYVENGKDVFSGFQFTLSTDDSVAAFDREYDDFTGEYALIREAGDIWRSTPSIAVNAEDSELIIAAGGEANPVSDDGIFFRVKMIAVGDWGDTTELTFTESSAVGLVDGSTANIDSTYAGGTVTIAEEVDEALEEAEAAVNDLFDNDGNLLENITQEDIDTAAALVAELEEGEDKATLEGLLEDVQEQFDSMQFVPVTNISLNQDEVFLFAGGANSTLIPSIMPEDATNKKVNWSSDNADVATVSVVETNNTSYAVVNPIAEGTAIITAKTEDGGLEATCDVKVVIPPTSVTLSDSELLLNENEEYLLQATVKPDNATNKNVLWESDNPDVASVNDEGQVTAQSPGVASVIVRTEDLGYIDICEVTVEEDDSLYEEAEKAVIKLFDEEGNLCEEVTQADIDDATELVLDIEDDEVRNELLRYLIDAQKQLEARTELVEYGDVTGDGKIAVTDAIAVLRHIVNLIDLKTDYPEGAFDRARVNGDDDVSVQDAILILRRIVGLIEAFPAEMVDKHPTTG